MPQVVFGNNQSISTGAGKTMTTTTDPHPMGGNDYVDVFWNLHGLYGSGGTPSAVLTWTLQISNDGQSWTDSAITDNRTADQTDTLREAGGFVRAAFIRFKYELNPASDNSAWSCFDIHANLMKSGS